MIKFGSKRLPPVKVDFLENKKSFDDLRREMEEDFLLLEAELKNYVPMYWRLDGSDASFRKKFQEFLHINKAPGYIQEGKTPTNNNAWKALRICKIEFLLRQLGKPIPYHIDARRVVWS